VGYNNAEDGGIGVWGEAKATSGWAVGVSGQTNSPGGTGVFGVSLTDSGWSRGVTGVSESSNGVGVFGHGAAGGVGVHAQSTTGTALYLKSDSGWLIHGVDEGDADTKFYVTNSGDVYADGAFQSPAGDFAEMLPGVGELEPGDVLVIGADGDLARSTKAGQSTVAGVYSTEPGFVGGAGTASEDQVPLAIVGVVPVKASAENGAIQPGDLLITADTEGHAMRADPVEVGGVTFYPSGIILGKAMAPLAEGTGVIEMLVTLQ
jgi:hypothetical protein